MTNNLIIALVVFALVWLILFVGVKISGQQIYTAYAQDEPEADPCDTCLRWPECHAVDAETCPHFPKGGAPDA